MVVIKTPRELDCMRRAGRIAAKALALAGEAVRPGISTFEIDAIARRYMESAGAAPSFLGYGGFQASACISVNEQVIHGIPSRSCILKDGDIVSIDIGAFFEGFHGDNAKTFACGVISEDAQLLIDATRESLYAAIEVAIAGNRTGDIGTAVERYAKARSYSVVRDFVGHGVGAQLHEDPSIPNYKTSHRGVRLVPGMTIAIEPMINQGTQDVRVLGDGWTVITADAKLSAHFEHTVAITDHGPEVLTLLD